MNLEMSNLPVKFTYKFGKLEKCVKKLFMCNFYSIFKSSLRSQILICSKPSYEVCRYNMNIFKHFFYLPAYLNLHGYYTTIH